MLFTSAGPTPYDLRFGLFGIPVRISPIFWLVALLLGGDQSAVEAAVWVFAVLVSVLVHELGHALVQRLYGGRPQVVLYAFGGLASAEGVRQTPWRNVLIALAGPLAGFALAGAAYAHESLFGTPTSEVGFRLLAALQWINVVWSVLNLAPIWPLDGGRVAQELLVMVLRPQRGVVASLALSIVCAGALAAYFFATTGSLWNTALFAMLAYQSYETLQNYQRSRGGW